MIFDVRLSVWLWLVFAALMGLILWRTTLGRYIYAAGGNEEAARLSGVRVGPSARPRSCSAGSRRASRA